MDDLTKKIAQLLVKASSDENYEKRLAAIIDNEYNLQYGEDKKEVVADSETKGVSEKKEQVETKQESTPVTTIFDEPRETASIKEENVENISANNQEEKKNVDTKQDEFSHFEIDAENISNEADYSIKVYDNNGDGNDSIICSNYGEIGQADLRNLEEIFGMQSANTKFVHLKEDGSCVIVFSTNDLLQYASKLNIEISGKMRGAQEYPLLQLKLTKEQLLAIDIDENTKFKFTNDMTSDQLLYSTRYHNLDRLPKIKLPFVKETKYKTNDLKFMRQFCECYGIVKNNRLVSLDNVIEKSSVGVDYSAFSSAKISFTNDGKQLNIRDTIKLAQMIVLSSNNEILRDIIFISGDSTYSMYCARRQTRKDQFSYNFVPINCEPLPASNKSKFSLRFDIKDGLCSPNNVKSLYNFIDNVGKDAIFANASRMEQILSDMEQGNEPTVSGKDAIININNKGVRVRSSSGYLENVGGFYYFLDGENERMKCKYDALKNVSFLAKECHYDGIVNDEELEHLRVVSETPWFDRLKLYIDTVNQNQKAATHSTKK